MATLSSLLHNINNIPLSGIQGRLDHLISSARTQLAAIQAQAVTKPAQTQPVKKPDQGASTSMTAVVASRPQSGVFTIITPTQDEERIADLILARLERGKKTAF